MTVFFFAFLSAVESVRGMDSEILDSARLFGLSGREMVFQVLLPAVLPQVIVQLKLYVIMSFMMLVFAETVGSPYGLGHWISLNHAQTNYVNLIAGFLEIGVLVTVLNKLVEVIQAKVVRWR